MKRIKLFFTIVFMFIFILFPLNTLLIQNKERVRIGGYRSIIGENQENDSDIVNANFAQSYYSNLNTGYFGYNNIDICGYVAIGMLLSYYDSFWNDNLIPEKFDKTVRLTNTNIENYNNSPGTDEVYFSSTQWADYLINSNNDRFVPNLVKIAYDLGYYEINNNSISFSHTTFSMIKNVVQNYLSNHQILNPYAFSITCVNHETNYNGLAENGIQTNSKKMRYDIIAYVKNGIPVLVGLSGSTPEDAGHVVIAYDYDLTQDVLYGHFGWFNNNKRHTNIEGNENYSNISAYIMLTPRCNHLHSNNIVIDEQSVCSCVLSNHIHEYVEYQAIDGNDKMHIAKCFCGYSKNEVHDYRVVGDNYVCQNCGFCKKYDGKFFPIIIHSIEEEILYIASHIKE